MKCPALVIFAAAPLVAAGANPNPLGAVVQLMQDLATKITKDTLGDHRLQVLSRFLGSAFPDCIRLHAAARRATQHGTPECSGTPAPGAGAPHWPLSLWAVVLVFGSGFSWGRSLV